MSATLQYLLFIAAGLIALAVLVASVWEQMPRMAEILEMFGW